MAFYRKRLATTTFSIYLNFMLAAKVINAYFNNPRMPLLNQEVVLNVDSPPEAERERQRSRSNSEKKSKPVTFGDREIVTLNRFVESACVSQAGIRPALLGSVMLGLLPISTFGPLNLFTLTCACLATSLTLTHIVATGTCNIIDIALYGRKTYRPRFTWAPLSE